MKTDAFVRRILSTAIVLGGIMAGMPVAQAEVLTLRSGDLSCLGYSEVTNDCASIQRGRPLPDGRIALADETHMQFGELKFAVATGFVARPEGDQLCVDPETVRIRAMPATNTLAKEFALDVGVALKMAARQGLCVQHRACGDDTVAEFFTEGERVENMTTRFRVFRKEDPRTASIRARAIGPAQFATLGKGKTDDCQL